MSSETHTLSTMCIRNSSKQCNPLAVQLCISRSSLNPSAFRIECALLPHHNDDDDRMCVRGTHHKTRPLKTNIITTTNKMLCSLARQDMRHTMAVCSRRTRSSFVWNETTLYDNTTPFSPASFKVRWSYRIQYYWYLHSWQTYTIVYYIPKWNNVRTA